MTILKLKTVAHYPISIRRRSGAVVTLAVSLQHRIDVKYFTSIELNEETLRVFNADPMISVST